MKFKSIILLLLVGISVLGNATQPPAVSEVRVDIHGQKDGIVLNPEPSESNIKVVPMHTDNPEYSGKILESYAPVDSDWRKFKIAFIPEKDGSVNMLLRGKYCTNGEQVWTIYDDISVEGASIKNGGFEDGMKSWRTTYCGPKDKRIEPVLLDDAKSGTASIKVSHNNNVFQKLTVTAGQKVVITFWAKSAQLKIDQANVAKTSSKEAKLPFANEWKVFITNDTPAGLYSAPQAMKSPAGKKVSPLITTPSNMMIDVGTLLGKQKGQYNAKIDAAILFNEFNCDKAETIQVGMSADWWMEVFLNGKPVYNTLSNGNDTNGFMHRVKLPVTAGKNTLAVRVLSGSGGWGFSYGTPVPLKPNIKFAENAEWKAVDMKDVIVKAGSALDLSTLVESPASKNGRVTIGKNGRLVFENSRDRQIRILGANDSLPVEFCLHRWKNKNYKELLKGHARALKNQGYNAIRIFLDPWWMVWRNSKDMQIDSTQRDILDLFLSELKNNGIYCSIVIFSYGFYFPLDKIEAENKIKIPGERADQNKLKMYLEDPNTLERFKTITADIFNHINPYTGLALKDDPAIFMVELYNEIEFGLIRGTRNAPELQKKLNGKFCVWLKNKYKSPQALSKAWNRPDITNFTDVEAPLNIMRNDSCFGHDYSFFVFDLSRNWVKLCKKAVRDAGYKGLMAQYDLPYWWMAENAARYEVSQVAMAHNYFNHPTGSYSQYSPTCNGRIVQTSSVGTGGSYWRITNSVRYADRPFVVTEYNHPFWNKYSHECGALYSAYSAFQGFDGLMIHSSPVPIWLKGNRLTVFDIGNSPIGRANEFLSACFFRRGDVTPAKHRVELQIPYERIGDMAAVSSEQNKIGLLTGFTVSFPWATPPQSSKTPHPADLIISPSGSAGLNIKKMAIDVIDTKDDKFSLTKFVKLMKQKGLLPANNITDPDAGIYQNETGEITMRTKENLLKVITAKSEAITLEAGKSELGICLKVVNSTVPACIAACAMDGKKLSDSSRIVLIYNTDAVNTGMEVSPDRVKLFNMGQMPVLMQVGELNATLKNDDAEKMSLYALGLNGERMQKLPVKYSEDSININIDTASLKNGPTPFFELSVE